MLRLVRRMGPITSMRVDAGFMEITATIGDEERTTAAGRSA
jgi:hypothetical protein